MTVDRLTRQVTDRIVPLVNRVRAAQAADGRIAGDPAWAAAALTALVPEVRAVAGETGQAGCAEAFGCDLGRWLAAGLDTPPDFVATGRAYRPGPDGAPSLLVAPIVTTNGPAPVGARLECLLIVPEEPAECRAAATALGTSPLGCRYARFVAGSDGYARGNCLVCFSESVAARSPDPGQHFAVFLMNKFHRIFTRQTLPAVRRLFGQADALFGGLRWRAGRLTPAETYAARCVWATGHEHYHQTGPRPLGENLGVKSNWFCGLLEELKVDARVVLAAARGDLPFHREVAEFVLFDRMFRYPAHPEATRNFDAGTGVFLFEWLAARRAITHGRRLRLDLDRCLAALDELAGAVTELERGPDAEYRAAARAFVRAVLPAGDPGDRFALPRRFARWARPTPVAAPESFADLLY